MKDSGQPAPVWRKASYSNGNCVQVARLLGGTRLVRDSKNPSGAALMFGGEEFDSFDLAWRTASSCGYSGPCVEVAHLPEGGRALRDSKNPTGEVLMFTPAEWTAFAAGVRAGEFD